MGRDVFISHSSQDGEVARAACRHLEARGISCWIAPRDILPGQDYGAAIVDGIRSARLFLLVLSSRSNESPQVKREVERAANSDLPIIPLRVEAVMPAPALEYFISGSHWLDAIDPPIDAHLDYLTDAAARLLGSAGESPRQSAPAPPSTSASSLSTVRRFGWTAVAAIALLVGGAAASWALFGGRGDAGAASTEKTSLATTIFNRRAVPLPSARQLRLRASPSQDAPIITMIAPDEVFRVAPRNGDWWPARLRSGNEGFVAHRWIRVIDEESPVVTSQQDAQQHPPVGISR